jgi:Ca2+-binding RTX toxin-like protein
MAIKGTAGNDNLSGTSGDDIFKLWQGGDDTADGGDGNDTFRMKDALTAADSIDGGTDNDTVALKGDYGPAVVFGAATMTNVEVLRLGFGWDYNLTTHDATVAAGARLSVNAGQANLLTFDGSAETDGRFTIFAPDSDDVLTGGAKGDKFFLGAGGNDTVDGGAGKDKFFLGSAFVFGDAIDGGAGDDTVVLDGAQSPFFFTATTIVNVEMLILGDGQNYQFSTHDANVGAGATLTVDYSAVGVDNNFFDGNDETDGSFHIICGAGNGQYVGGAGNDVMVAGSGITALWGLGGADDLTGGTAADQFSYFSPTESVSAAYDTIHSLDFDEDVFYMFGGAPNIAGPVSGTLSAISFDSDLAAAVGAGQMGVNDALIFTATGGTLTGRSFLVVNADGSAGYATGDTVIDITGYTGTLDSGDFIN